MAARPVLGPRNYILYDPLPNCSLCRFKRKQLLAARKAGGSVRKQASLASSAEKA